MRGAGILLWRRAGVASAFLAIPMALGITQADRGVARHAVLFRHGRKRTGAHRQGERSQCNHHASQWNLPREMERTAFMQALKAEVDVRLTVVTESFLAGRK